MRWVPFLAAAASLAAQEIKTIEVAGSPGQTYALFVPSNYTAERRWPILYCLDPGARGRSAVEHFAAAAEKAGFVVAGSNNSRNGPIGPSQTAIRVMVQDTHERLAIDDQRIYAAGLSGGARLALLWATGLNGAIAGVVASSAGFGSESPPKSIPFRIFMTTGFDDFNHDELYRLSRELAKRGVAHRYVEFEGGHEWLPASLAEEAFGYFMGTVPARAAEASKDAEKQAAEYERLLPLVETGDRGALRQVQKDAAGSEDRVDRSDGAGEGADVAEAVRGGGAGGGGGSRGAAGECERVVLAGGGAGGVGEHEAGDRGVGASGGEGVPQLGTGGRGAAAGQGAERRTVQEDSRIQEFENSRMTWLPRHS